MNEAGRKRPDLREVGRAGMSSSAVALSRAKPASIMAGWARPLYTIWGALPGEGIAPPQRRFRTGTVARRVRLVSHHPEIDMSSTLGSAASSEDVNSIFITAVRNTHALEKEARQIIERQLDRLENYPEMEAILRKHLDETNVQEQRIDEVLDTLGTDRSVLKDWATQLMGNAAALAHAPAGDEIIKNTFANHAFENFEIAAYKSLIVIAEAAGGSRFVPALQQSLKEEQKTAQLIYDQIEPITKKYLMRASSGQKADR
jgi:ferritin-like metal-binding protein YciE